MAKIAFPQQSSPKFDRLLNIMGRISLNSMGELGFPGAIASWEKRLRGH